MSEPSAENLSVPKSAPPQVLYIEDNFHNRRLVRKILASRGYEVVEAEDGLSGLEMLARLRPPLVLLDIGLPDVDGIEVVTRIRSDIELRDTPVIAITASAMRGDRERFLSMGCDDYLSKPLQALELIAMVEHYLKKDGEDFARDIGTRRTATPDERGQGRDVGAKS